MDLVAFELKEYSKFDELARIAQMDFRLKELMSA